MFLKIFDEGWENAAPECHYQYVDVSRVISVVPLLDVVDEKEDGLEICEEMTECELILDCGKKVHIGMKADEFVEKYLSSKQVGCKDEMGKLINDLTEENVTLYEDNKYMKSFLKSRSLMVEYSKYKLVQRSKEKARAMYRDELPFDWSTPH